MADDLDPFRNGDGQGADHGNLAGYGRGSAEAGDHGHVWAEGGDHYPGFDEPGDAGAEYPEDGYETLNNVAGWQIPEGAIRTEALRQVVIRLVARGLDDPRDLATLTLPGLVATIGQLESRLAEQEARIATVQQALIDLLHQIAGGN
jgi:hypothetical protein